MKTTHSVRLALAVLVFAVGLLWLASEAHGLQPPMDRYVVTSGVGVRQNPMGGEEDSLHRGVDLAGPLGAPILAAGSGVVVRCYPAPGQRRADGAIFRGHPTFGGYIVIDHGNGILTEYGHMSRVDVRTGQRVEAGQRVGLLGASGRCTGPHLHFALIVSPLLFFCPPIGSRDARELLR